MRALIVRGVVASGKAHRKGDIVEISDADFAALSKSGHVVKAPHEEKKEVVAEQPKEQEQETAAPKKRGRPAKGK